MRQSSSAIKGVKCRRVDRGCPLWVKSRHVRRTSPCPLSANMTFFTTTLTLSCSKFPFVQADTGQTHTSRTRNNHPVWVLLPILDARLGGRGRTLPEKHVAEKRGFADDKKGHNKSQRRCCCSRPASMSALGQKRTFAVHQPMSALPCVSGMSALGQ